MPNWNDKKVLVTGGASFIGSHLIDLLIQKGVPTIEAGVQKLVFASSGCVYPNFIQQDVVKELYLTEDTVGPPYDADNMTVGPS